MRRLTLALALSALVVGAVTATRAQATPFFPVSDLKPGMVGVGRTVFSGNTLEEFRATIIGVLRNAIGAKRDLILARLEGGPLANTGVIQGMSGSPVYIDGRLLGAVSYSLGSFAKEPIAGITPIAEMTEAVDNGAPRVTDASLSVEWPASPEAVFDALGRLAGRVAAPLGPLPGDTRVLGPQSLTALAPALRPIGASMVFSGFSSEIDRPLREALAQNGVALQSAGTAPRTAATATLAAGDPVGMSLVHGDVEMGATGTVTYVNNGRVYAFGHPFLNLGPTAFPMTKAQVLVVLPSLDTSMKISSLGPVIGTMNQDRATAVGGTLGAGPRELQIGVTLNTDGAPPRRFTFSVLRDPALTPLFAYVSVLSTLTSYQREAGAMTVSAKGTVSFGSDGQVVVDDLFTGDTASASAAAAFASPVGAAMLNDFRAVVPERIDVEFHASERRENTTIERVWLDTVHPRVGETHTLQVQLRDYRGASRVVSLPVTMPTHADGPVTLLVGDAATLAALEQRDLKPGRATNWPDLLRDLNAVKRGNRLYVRLLVSTAGTVTAGQTLPSLPSSIRSALDTDTTVARSTVSKTVVGSWEQRLDVPVRGSRELTLTLTSRQ
jgi:hypothetical protein